MKKLLSILISVLLIASVLIGCGDISSDNNSGKLSIVCTIFPQYDFCKEIGGDLIDVSMLISPGADIHGYEPSISDIQTINNADLFIYCSGESEGWATDIIKTISDKTKALDITKCVELLDEESVEGMESDGHHHDEHSDDAEKFDEHVWTSPVYAKSIVSQISEAMCKIDSNNKDKYIINTNNYLAKLDELDSKFKDAVTSGTKDTLVFADRFPFRYLLEEYDLNYYAAFKGCSSELEPSLSTVSFLINKTKELEIKTVLYTETSDQKTADIICEATGADKALLHSCHNLTKDEIKSGKTYLSLMNENVETIKEALK